MDLDIPSDSPDFDLYRGNATYAIVEPDDRRWLTVDFVARRNTRTNCSRPVNGEDGTIVERQ